KPALMKNGPPLSKNGSVNPVPPGASVRSSKIHCDQKFIIRTTLFWRFDSTFHRILVDPTVSPDVYRRSNSSGLQRSRQVTVVTDVSSVLLGANVIQMGGPRLPV